ncbi:hypothetical protein TRICI_002689 [Trichomonascus ciferrii]|uniref:Glycosyltransferase family 15 protein n=1 Tax=Trichomonascus ciferrii TaxID=44093 RepID=A0A642V7A3_9ASCO|nr:hypothetical protein TRICI_002689 [Trichomonascus ciferrii]
MARSTPRSGTRSVLLLFFISTTMWCLWTLSERDQRRYVSPLEAVAPLKVSHSPKSPENATFVTLARNSDLKDLLNTITSVEDRYNRRYHHDWVFLNDEPFSQEFQDVTSSLISGTAKFGVIPREHWSYPDWINQTEAQETRVRMKNIIYGDSESYRHMCRFESGFFFHHPLMQQYRYYWRVEPSTQLHCDIEYDVFRFMREKDKKYGFTITIHEYIATIESLWQVTTDFLKHYPQYVAKDNLMKFISDTDGLTYNLCHFWSNFEVADMEFWRGDAYQRYFNHLDQSGGFFYERWGDAPVHSIAASIFLNASQIHFFEDIGYSHPPYTHCPRDCISRGLKCNCLPKDSFDWDPYSCTKEYYNAQRLQMPPELLHQN